MGVATLWEVLRQQGAVQSFKGSEEQASSVYQEMECKVVAVDVSQWLMQAGRQQELMAVYSTAEECCVKVAFERASNWLRLGVVPVGVVDGAAPAEKLERQQQRFKCQHGYEGGGGGSWQFRHQGQLVARLWEAMGLPVMYAGGEAEAACAALNAAGLVDGVATNDSDALLFGATTVYHTLKLLGASAVDTEMAVCRAAGVRRVLGLTAGGAAALQALALLVGGDYDISGAARVGPAQALAAVKWLLRGDQDDSRVLERLAAALDGEPNPQLEALSSRGCTGCRRCGHEGGRNSKVKQHGSRNECAQCPAGEAGLCQDRSALLAAGQPCRCDFHRRAVERLMDKVVRKAQATPAFATKAKQARQQYAAQMADAAACAALFRKRLGLKPGDKLSWRARPDEERVARALKGGGLDWQRATIRRKLLPLLMEWDAAHPGPAAEFAPTVIVKGQEKAGTNSGEPWRWILKWQRSRPEAGSSGKAITASISSSQRSSLTSVRTAAGSAGIRSSSTCGDDVDVVPEHIALDREWLKALPADSRVLRKSVVATHWPNLLKEWQDRQTQKEDAKRQLEERKAARAARPSSKAASAQNSHSIKDFFLPKKGGKASRRDSLASVTNQPTVDGPADAGQQEAKEEGSPAKKQKTPEKASQAKQHHLGSPLSPSSVQSNVRRTLQLAGPATPSLTTLLNACALQSPSASTSLPNNEAARASSSNDAGVSRALDNLDEMVGTSNAVRASPKSAWCLKAVLEAAIQPANSPWKHHPGRSMHTVVELSSSDQSGEAEGEEEFVIHVLSPAVVTQKQRKDAAGHLRVQKCDDVSPMADQRHIKCSATPGQREPCPEVISLLTPSPARSEQLTATPICPSTAGSSIVVDLTSPDQTF